MAYETILVETRGPVGWITLNRPRALNALNIQLIGELNQALAAFEADPQIAVMVLTGSERAFAAGADVKEMEAMDFMAAFQSDFIGSWQQVAASKSFEQVRAELAQARKDGTSKAWSAGYIEKIQSVKSRGQVQAEVAAARRSGELDAIDSEAYAFAPSAAPTTVLASVR